MRARRSPGHGPRPPRNVSEGRTRMRALPASHLSPFHATFPNLLRVYQSPSGRQFGMEILGTGHPHVVEVLDLHEKDPHRVRVGVGHIFEVPEKKRVLIDTVSREGGLDRGNGVFRPVLDAAIAIARRKGLPTIFLVAGKRLVPYYESYGFKVKKWNAARTFADLEYGVSSRR